MNRRSLPTNALVALAAFALAAGSGVLAEGISTAAALIASVAVALAVALPARLLRTRFARAVVEQPRASVAVVLSAIAGPFALILPVIPVALTFAGVLALAIWKVPDWGPSSPILSSFRRWSTSIGVSVALVASLGAGIGAASLPFDKTPVVWAVAVSALMATPLVLAVRSRTFDLFEPIWPVLLFLWLQLPGQALYLVLVSDYELGLLPIRTWVPLINIALASAVGGTFALFAGYYLFQSAAGRCAALLPRFERRLSVRRLVIAVATLTITGLAAYAVLMGSVSGLIEFLSNLQQHNTAFRNRYHLYFTIQLAIVASLLMFAVGPHTRRWGAITALHGLFVFVLIFSLGGRALALALIEMALVIFNYGVRPLRVRWVFGFAVLAVVLMVLAGTYRSYTGERSSLQRAGLSTKSQKPLGQTLLASLYPRHIADELFQYDYSSLDMYVLLIDRMPNQFGFAWGLTVTDMAYRFVPRSIVEDKPFPFNTQINQKVFGEERSGKKASLLGEGFYNFYFPGVLLAMLALGFAARAAYSYLKVGVRTFGVIAVYAVLYKWVWSLTGGGFSEVTLYSIVLLGPLLIALWFVHSGPRQSAPR